LFPCESVYGVIEVKSSLTSGELDTAVINIRSLKSLERVPADMLDLLPHRRLNVGAGLSFDARKRNPYLGVIFAYDGLASDTILESLNSSLANENGDRMQLPDFIFNYRGDFTILRVIKDGQSLKPVPICDTYDRFISLETGTDTLPLFFLTVNICLNQLLLRAPDLNAYWTAVLNDSILRTQRSTT
jgi:hypothetical protein